MKIYTKKGDKGQTQLFGGASVFKSDLKIQTYGALDELSSVLGLVRAQEGLQDPLKQSLLTIQDHLFRFGSELALSAGKTLLCTPITSSETDWLEQQIDQMEKDLEPLKNFILPGGCLVAAHLHLARTVCRRAERELVALNQLENKREDLLKYINRLSDYLFVASRFSNKAQGVLDIPWVSGRL